ncbi:S-adenosyl methyltransferase [Asanoa hainanensis]|uniref:S-adenosyl methyltransferase n=1 Tax=Asanoa hainanensis TaxID=560556 RepID=A0A239PBI0_9ACTN|nr:S-adenosyl methyltransferase [Asanoa hainanensis]
MADHDAAPELDTTTAHSARIWNYWLGGKDNFAVDRAVGDEILGILPDVADLARASRGFLKRSVTYLVESGVRQFLDIGTGLPTADNTHEVAQAIAPECRVVYVDNDPLVLVHARALLVSAKEGSTAYVDADLRDVPRILEQAAHTSTSKSPSRSP